MDVFTQLNYCYPGTPDIARPHIPQQLQRSPYHMLVADVQSVGDPTRPVDFIASHDLRPQQRGTLVGPRGVVHPDSKPPLKICYTDQSVNLSDQYIPSSSDKITCTDHRPLDEIFGGLPPASGRSRTTSSSPNPPLSGRPHVQPQRSSVLTYALPAKPQLDGVVEIPLLVVDNQMSGTGLVVDFRCSDWGIGVVVEGIPMSDLLYGNVSGLESPHQRVLDGLGIINLRFNILWPNYPPFMKVISAFGTDRKPMTRAELGYEVSLAFAEFFYQITSLSIPPARPGPYAISSSSPGSSSPGIKFEQLHLITVRNTSRGEWMAEIRAISVP